MTHETIKVEGMSCGHCQMTVNKAITSVAGVSNVEVNLKDGQATVDFDESKTNTDTIKAAVVEAGYKA
ncbi:MAG TPA: copper chaperone [Methanosarcinaceae archaeon]|nr:copper chaperone [Methanosarcinaceae archaeon]